MYIIWIVLTLFMRSNNLPLLVLLFTQNSCEFHMKLCIKWWQKRTWTFWIHHFNLISCIIIIIIYKPNKGKWNTRFHWGKKPQTVTDVTLIPGHIRHYKRHAEEAIGSCLPILCALCACMQRGAALRAACLQTGVEYLNAWRFNWRSNWNRKLRNEEQPPSTGSLLAAQSGAA